MKINKILAVVALSLSAFAHAQVSQPVGPGGRPVSFAAKGILVGQGSANVTATGAGLAGQCLLSGGPGVDPSYGSCAAGATVSSVFGLTGAIPNLAGDVTTSGSTGTTLKNTGTAGTYGTVTTDAQGRVSAGTVVTPVINGGTGLATLTNHGVVIGAAASAVNITSAGTAKQALLSNGAAADPTFQNLTSGSAILSGDGAGSFSNVTIGSGLSFSAGTLSNTVTTPSIRGHMWGFTLSNDSTTPNSVLDIAPGSFTTYTGATFFNVSTIFTKSTAGAWVVGTGTNGMGNGLTIAASTWYHVFAIVNAGNLDYYFDTSPTAANAPASTTTSRYIGSFLTNGSAQIVAFKQIGQYFYWAVQRSDLVSGVAATPTLVTMSSPTGFTTYPIIEYRCNGNSSFWSPQQSAVLPVSAICNNTVGAIAQAFSTNTAAQIYYQITGGTSLNLSTDGYINPYVAANL